MFAPLADANISVDMIVQNAGQRDGTTDLTFTVLQSRSQALDPGILTETVPDLVGAQGERIAYDDEICKVSVVGVGMRSHAGRRESDVRAARCEGEHSISSS